MDRTEAIERAVGYADEGVLCVEAVFKALPTCTVLTLI